MPSPQPFNGPGRDPAGPAALVLATHNAHKVTELRRILSAAGVPVGLTGLDEFPGAPEVAETGLTFAENALLKARAIARVHPAAVGRGRLRAVRRRAGGHARHLFRPLVRPARRRRRQPRPGPGAARPTSPTRTGARTSPARPRWRCRTAASTSSRGAWTGSWRAARAAAGGSATTRSSCPTGPRADHRRDDPRGQGRDQPPRPRLPRPCASRCRGTQCREYSVSPGGRPPGPPECAPRPRGGTSPTHRPLAGPEGPARWAGNERLAVTCVRCSPIAPAAHPAWRPGSLGR